jgi:hypothetical protein
MSMTSVGLSLEINLLERCRQWSIIPERDDPSTSSLLSQSRAFIATLDAEIALKGGLYTLHMQRKRQDKLRRCYSSLLAPIRMLPEDVLHEIFMNCNLNVEIFQTSRYKRPKKRIRREGDWVYRSITYTLSQVCNHWRQILGWTPLSWSSISVSWSKCNLSMQEQRTQGALRVLRNALKLSEQHPLRIRMVLPTSPQDIMSREGRAFVDLIMAESHRWRDVVIRLGNLSQLIKMSQSKGLLLGSLPYLEHISLYFQPLTLFSTDFWSTGTTSILAVVPQLKSVTLDNLDPRRLLSLPWRQLTSVFIAGKSRFTNRQMPAMVTFILRHATQLQSLSVGRLNTPVDPSDLHDNTDNEPMCNEKNLVQSLEVGNPLVFRRLTGSLFPHLARLSIWKVDSLLHIVKCDISSFSSTMPQKLKCLELSSRSQIGTDPWFWFWDAAPRKLSYLSIHSELLLRASPENTKWDRLAQYLHSSKVSKIRYCETFPDEFWHGRNPAKVAGLRLTHLVKMLDAYIQLHHSININETHLASSHYPCLEKVTIIIQYLRKIPVDTAKKLRAISSSGMSIELRNLNRCVFLA